MASAEAATPQLRPLGLGEILDVAIKICLRHWKTLVTAVAIIVVPVQILSAIVLGSAFGTENSIFDVNSSETLTDEEIVDQFNSFIGAFAIAGLLGIVATTLATGACLRAIAQAYLGQPTDWRSSLMFALRRLHSLLWVTFIYNVSWFIAMFFFIAPGVWLYVAFAFCTPVLLIEGRRGFKALGRSFNLVTGMWWRTCGILLVGFLLALVVSSIVQTVFFLPMMFSLDNTALFVTMSAIAGSLGALIATPFQAAVLTVLYFDLRVRKEAFDLELLASQIGVPVPAVAPAATTAAAAAAATPPPQPAAGAASTEGESLLWPAPEDWQQPTSNGSDDPARPPG